MPLIDLYARFLFLCVAALHYSVIPSILFSVIPSVAEESRGNGLVMFFRFREMFRQRFACST